MGKGQPAVTEEDLFRERRIALLTKHYEVLSPYQRTPFPLFAQEMDDGQ